MVDWPRKTRDIRTPHMDSRVWDRFAFRPGDVVVASYAKSGTTWVQQIVAQLIHGGADRVAVNELSPWLDYRLTPPEALGRLEAQAHRRVVKTHLPLDALTLSHQARYLYVARDGRDVLLSLHHHHRHGNDLWYRMLGEGEGGAIMPRPDPDVRRYFRTWLEEDGAPFWPYFSHVASWWAARDLPNVRLLHYADLQADLPGQVRAIAAFLGLPLDEAQLPSILDHCSFDYMQANADLVAPLGGRIFDGGARTFVNRGETGRWRNVLQPADVAAYERRAEDALGHECARWLAGGLQSGASHG